MLDRILDAIVSAPPQKPLLVAIDGRSCSGKTTLAAALEAALTPTHRVILLHTDDFYLPRQYHNYERLGGNMDLDRLHALLTSIKRGESVCYRPFLCHEQAPGEAIPLAPADVVLVEGSYSLHSALFSLYDLTFCLTVTPEKQKERVLAREGVRSSVFFEKWIPLEEKYFADLERRGIPFLP